MKTNDKKLIGGILGAVLVLGFESFSTSNGPGATDPWQAPATASGVQNPFNYKTPAVVAAGKKIFTQFCVACHGAKGKGDGIAGSSLTPRPANFMSVPIVEQSDGSMFWKITTGKTPMPTWGSVLKPGQRWDVICYIRTLEDKYASVKPYSDPNFLGSK